MKYYDDHYQILAYPPYTVGKYVNLNLNMKIIKIATGSYFTLFLNEHGAVFSCGRNEQGQLGYGVTDQNRKYNYQVKQIKYFDKIIVNICCGDNHSLALDTNGRSYAWGNNYSGQCGVDRTINPVPAPNLITSPKIQDIKTGNYHSCIVTAKNEYYLFGAGFGQLFVDKSVIAAQNKNINYIINPVCINDTVKKQTGLNIVDIILGDSTVLILNDKEFNDDQKEKENIEEYIKQIKTLNGTISEQQKELDDLKQKMQFQQMQINQFQDDQKQYELEISALKQENKILKLKNIDAGKYETWSAQEIVRWIMSLDSSVFGQYEEILTKTLSEEEVTGEDLVHATGDDIKRWGIKKFKNIRIIMQHIKDLSVNSANKNNEGSNT
eukprot:45657_1